MSSPTDEILAHLQAVADERARRAHDPVLLQQVAGLKRYQQQRFAATYADLLAAPRYAPAARYFLDELYGPADYTHRDAQFARVVPSLVRMMPQEVIHTVTVLSSLHALTEQLDTAMAQHLSGTDWTPENYRQAWQETGRRADRETQVTTTLQLASRLDGLTRNPLLRKTLHLMRMPARLSGLRDLQHFLEIGFDAFATMGGAQDFIAMVEARERAFVAALFEAGPERAAPA